MLSKTMSAVLIGAAGIGATAVPASAATMMTTGTIQVWVTPHSINSPVSKIVITGVIGDYGTATSVNKNGTPNTNGNYEKIVLQHGGFMVNSVALNKKTNTAPPLFQSMATCSVVFGATGPTTLFNGTGAYTGITGTIVITERFAGVGPWYTSGAKKGQCNTTSNQPPVGFYASITGTGKVSFG